MKLSFRLKVFSMFLSILLLLVSCNTVKDETTNNTVEDEMTKPNSFYGEYTIDDSSSLSVSLTKKYNIQELKSFFSGAHMWLNIDSGEALTINEVNQVFPVQVVRSNSYTVYKVIEGDYFFVFWTTPVVDGASGQPDEPFVYYSIHLPSSLKRTDFEVLKAGESTASDVVQIDPSFEMVYQLSSGIYSYSALEDGTLAKIEYFPNNNLEGYDDYANLIVERITIVKRDGEPSKLSSILAKDYP